MRTDGDAELGRCAVTEWGVSGQKWPGGMAGWRTASGADAFADRSTVALRCSCLLDSLARHCSLPALPSPPSHPPDIHVLPVPRTSPPHSPAASSHPPSYPQIRRKLVIVGDGAHPSSVLHSPRPHPPFAFQGACGKTSLLCSFALGEFPKEYVSPLSPLLSLVPLDLSYSSRRIQQTPPRLASSRRLDKVQIQT